MTLERKDVDQVIDVRDRAASVGAAEARKRGGLGVNLESGAVLGSHVVAAIMLGRQLKIHAPGFSACGLIFNAQVRKPDLPLNNLEAIFLSNASLGSRVFRLGVCARLGERGIRPLL